MEQFQQIRNQDGRIDIDLGIKQGSIIPGDSEYVGARPKFWFNNNQFMYKEVYSETYEDYAELIALELAKALSIPCAEYDLAISEERNGVITRNIINEDEGEELISGKDVLEYVFSQYIQPLLQYKEKYLEIITKYFGNINPERGIEPSDILKLDDTKKAALYEELFKLYVNFSTSMSNILKIDSNNNWNLNLPQLINFFNELTHLYNDDFKELKNGLMRSNNLYDIWQAIDIYSKMEGYQCNTSEIMSQLIDILIFDLITSEGDRHAENWSIIVNKRTHQLRLSPMYDNSKVFCLSRSKAISNILSLNANLEKENDPIKQVRIKGRIHEAIDHSNSGIKITYESIMGKDKNYRILIDFINHSEISFIRRLSAYANKIDDNLITKIFQNIQMKTGRPVPDDIQKMTRIVLQHNIQQIKDVIQERLGKDER